MVNPEDEACESDDISSEITRYLDFLLVEKGLSDNTLNAYQRDLHRYREFLTYRQIGDCEAITPEIVAEFRDTLFTGIPELSHVALAPSSVARCTTSVRGFHKFLAADGIVADNPALGVAPPKLGTRLPKALPVDTVFALLEGAGDGSSADPVRALRDRALLEMLYSTGARISEVTGLSLGDVDVAQESVLLHGKGDKDRIVPVGGPALFFYEEYLTRSRPILSHGKTHAAFLNTRGNPLSRQSAWAILQDAAARAGIDKHVSPHALRHSFATHMLSGGADVRVVQELLGHASVTTTQIYTMVSADSLRSVWAESHPRAR